MERPIRVDEVSRAERAPLRAWGPLTDGPRARTLLASIRGRLDRGARSISLDLSRVPFLDGGGIGVLLKGRSAALRRGAEFRIEGASGAARQTLRLAGLLDLLEDQEPAPARLKPAGQDAPLLLSA
jgi:anti-anti-sigma factor